ncbi:MAG: DUF5063 domain-containing protein [Bacteroidales bacterium]|nr:DUF5063 domain-containing protein [Bacteroidales bacterium]
MHEESTPVHKYVYSSEIVEFVAAANEYCRFLEQLTGTEGKAFISDLVKHLSGLYALFLKTGETEPVFDSAPEPTVTEQEWSALFQRITEILGPFNDILRVAEEDEFDRSELVSHTISEDVADVYQELKDFSIIYSRGMEEFMNDAAWELRERFAEHWGMKLLRALSALHNLYVADVDPTHKE